MANFSLKFHAYYRFLASLTRTGIGVMPRALQTWLPKPRRWPEQIAQCHDGHHKMTQRIAPA
jgi:hypothetical protein